MYDSNIINSVRKLDTLKYQLRSIDLYYSNYIDNLYLIVEDKTEFEKLYKNLIFVEHKDFIPESIISYNNINLMDLYILNIEQLSDNFIYMRENWFFLKYHSLFFKDYPIFNIIKKSNNDKITDSRFYSDYKSREILITSNLKDQFTSDYIIYPKTIPIALRKNLLSNVKNWINNTSYENIIESNNFSGIPQKTDINYLIYGDYLYYTDNYITEPLNTKFIKLYNSINKINQDFNNIAETNCFLSLLNIDQIKTVEEFEEKKVLVNSWLEQRFPDKCKYEI